MKRLPWMVLDGHCPACVEPIRKCQRTEETPVGEVHRKCLRVTALAFEREMREEVAA